MSTTRRLLEAAACAVFLLTASAALAQEPPAGAAERDKARAALGSGDVAGACLLFEQSHKAAVEAAASNRPAVPPDEILFDLADCHAKQQKPTVAAAEFDQVAAGAGSQAAEAKDRATALRGPAPAAQPGPAPGEPG